MGSLKNVKTVKQEIANDVFAAGEDVVVADFKSLKEATPQEFENQMVTFEKCATADKLAGRALNMFKQLKGMNIGNLVDQFEHGLQTATLAYRDGADEETVVCGLLHDIGEVMSPCNHGEIAGALLRPFISPQNYWTLIHHEIFQSTFYQHAVPMKEKDLAQRFKDSPYFQGCMDFCEKYDQAAFNPDYKSEPLEFFEPMVHRVFAKKPYWHPDHKKDPTSAAKIMLGEAYPDSSENQEPPAKKIKVA